jgi:hypothetical protein
MKRSTPFKKSLRHELEYSPTPTPPKPNRQPWFPPVWVVLYKTPPGPNIIGADGREPSVPPKKLYSNFGV